MSNRPKIIIEINERGQMEFNHNVQDIVYLAGLLRIASDTMIADMAERKLKKQEGSNIQVVPASAVPNLAVIPTGKR